MRNRGFRRSTANFAISLTLLALLGAFFIWLSTLWAVAPREEAKVYEGEFYSFIYEDAGYYLGELNVKRDTEIAGNLDYHLDANDSYIYYVYLNEECATEEVVAALEALTPGTPITVLEDPSNYEAVEIVADGVTILSYDEASEIIDGQRLVPFWVGIGIVIVTVLLAAWIFGSKLAQSRRGVRARVLDESGNDTPLREADFFVKNRILLEAKTYDGTLEIVYRRVKSTNELVVNGQVYDEYVALMEFEHNLYATVNGHRVEAGIDGQSFSYIAVDGSVLAQRRRLY